MGEGGRRGGGPRVIAFGQREEWGEGRDSAPWVVEAWEASAVRGWWRMQGGRGQGDAPSPTCVMRDFSRR